MMYKIISGVIFITVMLLTAYIIYPRQLKLEATSKTIIAKDGFTTFNFDPPIEIDKGSFRIIRVSSSGNIVSMEVYVARR